MIAMLHVSNLVHLTVLFVYPFICMSLHLCTLITVHQNALCVVCHLTSDPKLDEDNSIHYLGKTLVTILSKRLQYLHFLNLALFKIT